MQVIQYYERVMGEEAARAQGPTTSVRKELVSFAFVDVSHSILMHELKNLAGC
jgi:hypothetical protein